MSLKKILSLMLFVFSFNCFAIYKTSSQLSDSEAGSAQGSEEDVIPSWKGSHKDPENVDYMQIVEKLIAKRLNTIDEMPDNKKIKLTEEPYADAFFSKSDDISGKLQDCISKETNKIRLAVYWFYDWFLAGALVEAKNRNIPVEIIIDISSIYRNGKYDEEGKNVFDFLKKHIDNTYLYNSPAVTRGAHTYGNPLMHNKFMLLDGCKLSEEGVPVKLLANGSFNFTEAANQANEDNVTIQENEKLFNKYAKKFEEIKSKIEKNEYK